MCNLKVLYFMGIIVLINGISLDNLKSALTTHRQKFWTRFRSFNVATKGHKHECIYAEVRPMSAHEYIYLQHYEVASKWHSNLFYATVLPPRKGGNGPIMRVSSKRGAQGVDYMLLFWDATEHCALFTRIYKGQRHCEMHVWQDHVAGHVPRCQLAYKAFCSGLQEFPIYTRQCRP
uniref:Putative group i salivary lipocalin n=1 Tax=Rhipicephalus pulchellus TaxID=72859 RepID=L7LQL5_RHIPC